MKSALVTGHGCPYFVSR